jgi:hypothetical protein
MHLSAGDRDGGYKMEGYGAPCVSGLILDDIVVSSPSQRTY